MSQFKFRLGTLLKMRQTLRDQRRTELAEGFRAEEIVRRQEDELAEEVKQTNERIRQASQPGNVNVDALIDAHRYELVIAARRHNLSAQRKQLDEEIERRRQKLVEADRQVRVLEKLSQRQQRDYDQNEQRREVKQMDEIAARVPSSGVLQE